MPAMLKLVVKAHMAVQRPCFTCMTIALSQGDASARRRDYDIMGYPSLKFFPPQAPTSSHGTLRKGHSNEQKDIKGDMLAFVENTQKNHTHDAYTDGWPIVSPLTK